jgi:hypothetical protein
MLEGRQRSRSDPKQPSYGKRTRQPQGSEQQANKLDNCLTADLNNPSANNLEQTERYGSSLTMPDPYKSRGTYSGSNTDAKVRRRLPHHLD